MKREWLRMKLIQQPSVISIGMTNESICRSSGLNEKYCKPLANFMEAFLEHKHKCTLKWL